MAKALENLLVVRLSALGDIVHSAHAVSGLKRLLPTVRVAWVVEDRFAPLLDIFPFVDDVLPVSIKSGPGRALNSAARLSRAASGRFDAVVDLQGLMKSALAARAASGGARLIGYAPPEGREHGHFLYRVKVPAPEGCHVAGKQAALLSEAAGLTVHLDRHPPVTPPPVSSDVRRPYAVLVAGTARASKVWPREHFVSLGLSLRKRLNVYVSGGPGEREVVEGIASEAGVVPAPAMNLPGLAGFLARAEVVVGADTGPVHLASALGTPVAAIFGPVDPVRNGPLGTASRVIAADIDCRPCMQRYCPRKAGGPAPCVEQVEPAEVLQAVDSLLDARKGGV